MLQLARQMGIPLAELAARMSVAEFRDHVADMSLAAKEQQKQSQQRARRPRRRR